MSPAITPAAGPITHAIHNLRAPNSNVFSIATQRRSSYAGYLMVAKRLSVMGYQGLAAVHVCDQICDVVRIVLTPGVSPRTLTGDASILGAGGSLASQCCATGHGCSDERGRNCPGRTR